MHKFFKGIIPFSFFAILHSTNTYAQDKTSEVKNMVDSRQFIFHAQSALPMSGGRKQLTSEYYLKVFKDSAISELPYFGRAYSASYGATEGGFHFTTTKFDYSSTPGKKGGWEISIKPKDVRDVREFSLSISDSGYGTLQAFSNNRQPISFNGYISSGP